MTRHVLSLSGGKDSAALAVYLRDRVPEMEYIFHDTGKELPETYDYMARLESILGRPVTRTTPEDPFEHWLAVYGDMLPSNHRRWCTKMLKLKPFETYIGDDPTINYVGLRADEKRTGYISTKPNITAVYPFQEDGLVRADVIRILEDSGLGLPPYMEWGRSRSGCYFCFYQQKIEWVRLKRKHPNYFELAKQYEVRSAAVSKSFTWCSGESLTELEQPERMEQIERNHEVSVARRAARRENLPLSAVLGGADIEEEEPEGCLICSL
ncbi:phosphoadenosine phosphosulfate reductase family protein [Sphingomonas sp. 22176]|uniref:phosphoadenosine phosphosulfate reductase family protein n=1 Tax=Sphingomonas sp. 22176 TaxID=3453884 RepID=UPI003F8686D7